jgi:hypothetical protein
LVRDGSACRREGSSRWIPTTEASSQIVYRQ